MTYCRSRGADLIKVSSVEENQFIQRTEPWWLSLHRNPQNDHFFGWNDGSSANKDTTYTNWGFGEPNNSLGDEDCVELSANGLWNDANCNLLKNFACEKGKHS